MTTIDLTLARAAVQALRGLEIEEAQRKLDRRRDVLGRVREAIARVGAIGAPHAMLERAAHELGASASFDRVMISRVRDDVMTPQSLWEADTADDASEPLDGLVVRLAYPMVEAEVVQRPDAEIVDVAATGRRSPPVLRERFAWTSYVVATLRLHGKPIGLLHADATRSGRRLDDLDREVAELCADAVARSFELAVLRQTLQHHRDDQWTAVSRISERLRLSESAATHGEPAFGEPESDPLTPREREVVELLGQGLTNAAIARSLTISEGTVKYHVANLLRKLGATSRADAVARHLRRKDT